MNTVLDDNRTLCLPNGERVKLNGETMRALFEVQVRSERKQRRVKISAMHSPCFPRPQDLEVASPATVSRCGMVWLEPGDLGWRPFVKTWMTNLHEQVSLRLSDSLSDSLTL